MHESTFETLWTLEGLGYRSAQQALKKKPGGPFVLEVAARLPVRLQGIFHVGAAIVLAKDYLGRAAKDTTVDSREVARSYFQACAGPSSQRLRGIAAESLGFVAATLFPKALQHTSDAVRQEGPGSIAFFWHGVGRGLYLQYPPALSRLGRSWPLLRSVLNVLPGVEDEAKILEGYGWALGLVNLRQPSVVRRRSDSFATRGDETDALRCGLREALCCWFRWQGWDGTAGSIGAFAPTDPRHVEDWRTLASTLIGASETNAACWLDRTYGELLVPADSTGEWK